MPTFEFSRKARRTTTYPTPSPLLRLEVLLMQCCRARSDSLRAVSDSNRREIDMERTFYTGKLVGVLTTLFIALSQQNTRRRCAAW